LRVFCYPKTANTLSFTLYPLGRSGRFRTYILRVL
jgi:hypothetical protein